MTIEYAIELWVLATYLSCCLIIAVLLIRAPVARWLGARWAYRLWLVPILGLVAFVVHAIPEQQLLNPGRVYMPAGQEIMAVLYPLGYGVLDSTAINLWLVVWIVGVATGLGWWAVRVVRDSLVTRQSSRELTGLESSNVRALCSGFARRIDIEFRLLDSSDGPAVTGVFRPVLLLPSDFFTCYSDRQQSLMLRHELQHLSRRDLIVLSLARIFRWVFWFNPLVWVGERYLRLDQELSCDERVLTYNDLQARRSYGEAMIQAARSEPVAVVEARAGVYSQLKQRILMLGKHHQELPAAVAGLLVVGVAFVAAIAFGSMAAIEPVTQLRPELDTRLSALVTGLNNAQLGANHKLGMTIELSRQDSMSWHPPLSDFEVGQIAYLTGLAWNQAGDQERGLRELSRVPGLVRHEDSLKSQAFVEIAKTQFRLGNNIETLKALNRAQRIEPIFDTPELYALQGSSHARLKNWDRALVSFNRAIELAITLGTKPEPDWYIAQTALKLKEGDTLGAQRSLRIAMDEYPDTAFDEKLSAFDQWIQQSWEPEVTTVAFHTY